MNQMKKVVVKLNSLDEKSFFLLDGIMVMKNPMQASSSIQGIVSMELNAKDNKITIIGEVDPVEVVKKLRKWHAKIDTVGPAKEEKKPAADKKDDGDKKKAPTEEEQMAMLLQAYKNYYNHDTHYIQPYPTHIYEENPNACVIC